MKTQVNDVTGWGPNKIYVPYLMNDSSPLSVLCTTAHNRSFTQLFICTLLLLTFKQLRRREHSSYFILLKLLVGKLFRIRNKRDGTKFTTVTFVRTSSHTSEPNSLKFKFNINRESILVSVFSVSAHFFKDFSTKFIVLWLYLKVGG